ncbi:MAG TPA: DUF111 family protein, partial [Candidatus Hydrogenedentes bacterium]|nr:DUF111 family protein [Candidatus Hydrogenedentota bacterium]
MKTLYLDCFCGISGDMTVGALIDAGVELAYLQTVAASLNLGGVKIRADKVQKHGLQATHYQVVIDPDTVQPHRHLKHIIAIIQQADVTDLAKESAIAVFEKNEFVSYAACGMPYYISDEIKDYHSLLAIDKDEFISKRNIAINTFTEVTEVDFTGKSLKVKSEKGTETHTWDKLIIATGASAALP